MTFIYDALAETTGTSITRGTVAWAADAHVRVVTDADGSELGCELLNTADGAAMTLEAGDAVLVWRATPDADTGVILGRIGAPRPTRPEPSAPEPPPSDVPQELVIEATKMLTLRVGDGSITIRGDGKILIKGKDLVSHAQRTNRIRGGAVAIN